MPRYSFMVHSSGSKLTRDHRSTKTNKLRSPAVMLVWSFVVFMMLLNKEKINMNTISTNLQTIVTIVWYGMVAASSFMTCLFLRTTLKTLAGSEAGSIMAVIFNVVLATAISLNIYDISLKSRNTPIEEMILCAAAGYNLYEMFFLRLAENVQDRYKAVGGIAVTSFIVNSLHRSKGASIELLFMFLFASTVPVMKLPSFGSSKYVNTVAYKCSVYAAYIFTIFQRVFVGLGLLLNLWSVPEMQVDEFEMPIWVSIYCMGVCVTYFLIEVIKGREQEKLKMEMEEKRRIQECDQKLMVKDRETMQQDGGMERSLVVLKRKVVYAYE